MPAQNNTSYSQDTDSDTQLMDAETHNAHDNLSTEFSTEINLQTQADDPFFRSTY
jgi:hypothetical protein